MIADAFDDGMNTTIAHAEAFAGDAAHVSFSTRGTIQGDVADDDVLFGHKGRFFGRGDDNFTARESFAEVVVAVAFDG